MLQKNESKIYYSKYLTGHYWFLIVFLYMLMGILQRFQNVIVFYLAILIFFHVNIWKFIHALCVIFPKANLFTQYFFHFFKQYSYRIRLANKRISLLPDYRPGGFFFGIAACYQHFYGGFSGKQFIHEFNSTFAR